MAKRDSALSWALRTGQILIGAGLGLALMERAFYVRDGGAFPHLKAYNADPELGVRLIPGEYLSLHDNPITG